MCVPQFSKLLNAAQSFPIPADVSGPLQQPLQADRCTATPAGGWMRNCGSSVAAYIFINNFTSNGHCAKMYRAGTEEKKTYFFNKKKTLAQKRTVSFRCQQYFIGTD